MILIKASEIKATIRGIEWFFSRPKHALSGLFSVIDFIVYLPYSLHRWANEDYWPCKREKVRHSIRNMPGVPREFDSWREKHRKEHEEGTASC